MEVEFCEIDAIDNIDLITFVYDIEVEEDHSYVVADNFVVHNSACTTRSTTGFGVSQFSAIQDCSEIANRFKVPIIADGGIRNSRDIVLALAAGASTVMIGKLFALTYESAAKKMSREVGDKFPTYIEVLAKYRGQASKDFQDEARGGLKKGTVAEGEHFWAPVEKGAQQLIDELLGGLRSALTYGGARTISELQRKAEFVEVTPTYQSESSVRK
jgi:IMP dehydrogenase